MITTTTRQMTAKEKMVFDLGKKEAKEEIRQFLKTLPIDSEVRYMSDSGFWCKKQLIQKDLLFDFFSKWVI